MKGKSFETELKATVKDHDLFDLFNQILNSNKEKIVLDAEKLNDYTSVIFKNKRYFLLKFAKFTLFRNFALSLR